MNYIRLPTIQPFSPESSIGKVKITVRLIDKKKSTVTESNTFGHGKAPQQSWDSMFKHRPSKHNKP